MMWLKACPRCTDGAMYLDEDQLKHCMQCGFILSSVDATTAQLELAKFLGSDSATKVEQTEGIAV